MIRFNHRTNTHACSMFERHHGKCGGFSINCVWHARQQTHQRDSLKPNHPSKYYEIIHIYCKCCGYPGSWFKWSDTKHVAIAIQDKSWHPLFWLTSRKCDLYGKFNMQKSSCILQSSCYAFGFRIKTCNPPLPKPMLNIWRIRAPLGLRVDNVPLKWVSWIKSFVQFAF